MLFSAVPAAERAALEQRAPLRRYAEGALIQSRGEQADGFYLIERGSVAVGQIFANGDFRSVALLGPGDSWGELAMFTQNPRVVDAIAREASAVRYISEAAFSRVLNANPHIMRELLSALSFQLQELLAIVAGIRRGSARPRIAAMLASMSRDRALPAQVALTQQELAELLGLTRATVNAVLGELEQAGLVERGYGMLNVLDHQALEERSLED